ncbi:AMP-binding protein [Vannielia litorea]|uniref:AMP-binding protein n=1 Tax=Vannielia litorea TaxID=1217970 RepID=UPI001BCCF524|nr:AMP-binding protein [Vannielia litorea]MBS8224679.1 hypothetical protein [Vannielia litorea]
MSGDRGAHAMGQSENEMTLADAIRLNAKFAPARTAFICEDRRVSFSQFAERVYRLANALLAKGMKPGDRLGILSTNRIEFMEAYGAAEVAGFIAVPMNYRLAATDVGYMAGNAGILALILENSYRSLTAELHGVEIFEFEGNGNPESGYEKLLASGSPDDPHCPIAPGDLAYMFYTGGTTGKPKGVLLDNAGQMANLKAMLIEAAIAPADTLLTVMPLYHIGGKNFATAHFHRGCTGVLMPSFDPETLISLIRSEGVRCVLLAPTMISMIVEYLDGRTSTDLGLKSIYYSSAPMPVSLLRKAIALFGPVFMQFYGLTESGPGATMLGKEDHDPDGPPEVQALLASAGRPMIHNDVELVDDNDRPLTPGHVGEVRIRSAALMRGYWNNEAATRDNMRNGWVYSGDYGMFDENGFLFVVGRKKEMIVSGGENIYPREIEEILNAHPQIAEVAVVGVPDKKWGEAVKAVVVARQPNQIGEAEVIAYCESRLAGFKKPKSVEFWPELPKSPLGKILKDEIRSRYWAGRDRKI